MADLPPLEIPGLTSGAARVVGAGAAEAVALSPLEILHRVGDPWLSRAPAAERAELLRAILQHYRAPKSLLRMLEGGMGERVVDMPANKIPKAILKAVGGHRKQAQFTELLGALKKGKADKAIASHAKQLFRIGIRAAEQAGVPAAQIEALKAVGAEEVLRAGPANMLRVHDMATKESHMRRFLRWATRGDPVVSGKKYLGTGPSQNLAAEARAQLDELVGMEKTKLADEVAEAKGVFGKGKAAVKGVAARAGEAVSPKGMTAAEEGMLGKLTKAGAKGLGRGARLARGMGSMGTVIGVPLIAHEVYDSLVGKSKRARAALEASRAGGTPSVSQELMYDVLDRQADIQARRAALAQNPQLMQQIVQALGGSQAKTLTSSEAGFGIDLGPQGPSPDEMDGMLDRLLGQMRGT